jgi:predicted DNA-binding antitoxin AbrB/MazE fold protein
MLPTVRAVYRNGRIELLEPIDVPEGADVLVTLLSQGEDEFWRGISQISADEIWGNDQDDVYGQLLED